MAGRWVGETAVGIAAAVRAGRVTPAEVLEEHLERIAALDGRLGAFALLRTEAVRAEARALGDRGDLDGLPLAGVPMAIKDNVGLAGTPTRNGSRSSATSWLRRFPVPARRWSGSPTCWNSSNTRPWSASAIPTPVSATVT